MKLLLMAFSLVFLFSCGKTETPEKTSAEIKALKEKLSVMEQATDELARINQQLQTANEAEKAELESVKKQLEQATSAEKMEEIRKQILAKQKKLMQDKFIRISSTLSYKFMLL